MSNLKEKSDNWIQVCAVALQWIDAIDRRKENKNENREVGELGK